jgi:hypothetical protein
MWRRNLVLLAVVAVVLGGVGIEQALFAADAGAAGAGQRGPPRDPAQMQQRMEQFRQQAAERMKTTLGVNDEEWKVLQPAIDAVQTLARQLRGGAMGGMGGMGGMFGGRRGGPGGDANAAPQPVDPNRVQSDIEKKMSALQTVLANKEAAPAEIQAALTAVREARVAAQAKLDAAETALRKIVTGRQEGHLFVMGVLH